MLRPIFILLFFCSCTSLFSQTPQGINYQAVIRNNIGQVISNSNIKIRIAILDSLNDLNPSFIEQHDAKTSEFGLIQFIIGKGTPVKGVFNNIHWNTTAKYLEIALDSGGVFKTIQTSPLMSVPYALSAGSVSKSYGWSPINIIQYGAIPDDDSPKARDANDNALRALQDSMKYGIWDYGLPVYVPPHAFYFKNDIHITKAIELFGAGILGPSKLILAPGKSVIIDMVSTSPNGHTGSYSMIRDIQIHSEDNWNWGTGPFYCPIDAPSGKNPGIKMLARARLRDILISGFNGTGIEIIADAIAFGTNANTFEVTGGMVFNCGGHGLQTGGGDANAGMVSGLEINAVGGNGIYEDGFLGNTYISCIVNVSKGHAFRSDKAPMPSTFINCYAEGGDTRESYFAFPTVVIGGTFGSGMVDIYATEGLAGAMHLFNSQSNTPMVITNYRGSSVKSYLGLDDSSNTVFGWESEDEGGFWLQKWYKNEKVWGTEYLGSPGLRASYLTGRIYDPKNFSYTNHKKGLGLCGFPTFLLGEPDNAVKVQSGSSKPASNTGSPGDIMYNSAPVPGGYSGWICIDNQSGGTIWKGFGLIEN